MRGWIQHEGGEYGGLTDWETGVIRISSQVPRERRRTILFHELRHAWQHEHGEAQSPEEDARQAAAWSIDMNDQLTAQGGNAALLALKPQPTPAEKEIRCSDPSWNTPAPIENHYCPMCRATIPPGAVMSDLPQMSPSYHKPAVERGFYCGWCNVVICWTEGATDKGMPNGKLIGGVRFLDGARASQWLAEKGPIAQLHVA